MNDQHDSDRRVDDAHQGAAPDAGTVLQHGLAAMGSDLADNLYELDPPRALGSELAHPTGR